MTATEVDDPMRGFRAMTSLDGTNPQDLDVTGGTAAPAPPDPSTLPEPPSGQAQPF